MRGLRRGMYRGARLLGDVQAVSSGSPRRIAKRVARRVVGRQTARLLWRVFR